MASSEAFSELSEPCVLWPELCCFASVICLLLGSILVRSGETRRFSRSLYRNALIICFSRKCPCFGQANFAFSVSAKKRRGTACASKQPLNACVSNSGNCAADVTAFFGNVSLRRGVYGSDSLRRPHTVAHVSRGQRELENSGREGSRERTEERRKKNGQPEIHEEQRGDLWICRSVQLFSDSAHVSVARQMRDSVK